MTSKPIPANPSQELTADIICESGGGIARHREPVTCGVPWPRGTVGDLSRLSMVGPDGQEVAVQARALDCWPDGSVKWTLVDWFASAGPHETVVYRLTVANESVRGSLTPQPSVQAVNENGLIAVNTGVARFLLGGGSAFPFQSVETGGKPAIDPARMGLRIEDDRAGVYTPVIETVVVEDAGPVRATVRQQGRLVDPAGKSLCGIECRLSFFGGSATVRLSLTVSNPRKAGHPGGCWDLGQKGSIYIRDASVTIGLLPGSRKTTVRVSPELGHPSQTTAEGVEVYQDSSGGENWQSHNHLNRRRQVQNSFRGYRLRVGNQERIGRRATPVLCLEDETRFLGIAMPKFWQNFPKAVEAGSDCLTLRLFPRQYADLHEIQGGEQKTHTFYVAFGRDTVTDEPMEWCRHPLTAYASPYWYCSTGAVPYLLPKAEDPSRTYLDLVDAAIDGPDSFEQKREVVDEYGWRHFGDIYADHEAVFHKGPAPLVSHYNNQYDAALGFALQFMRSGDCRWLRQMVELASHVYDIDVYHTDGDKSAYNHGMFWHTCHHVDADTAGHRTYPAAKKVRGGGPNAGHLYTSGMMMHYLLTGDPLARQTVVELGQHVIDADDGRKTVFRWLSRSHTGTASESAPGYHGPGRAAANAVNALIDAHRLTRNQRFLEKAEQLIRRCIHPCDSLAARNLENVEQRWFYTMFLQSLGKYLDYKIELGQLDCMYAYTQRSLLHYAHWMAEHEYPYLAKPDILEYPTETWAAQDMRKSEVFCCAARHAADERARAAFLERSDFFFRASTETLAKMPTRTLARPVVLLLTNGLMHGYFQEHPLTVAPTGETPPEGFGEPEAFVPQKVRAKRLLVWLAAGGLLAVGVVATFVLSSR